MITGVVLCGGNSKRMGRDKGLLPHAAETWVQAAFDKLQALNIPVVVSINPTQIETYRAIFPEELLITDNTTFDIGGPLKGILSVHEQYPQNDLLVLAVDMVNMSEHLLRQLYSCQQWKEGEAFVFKHALHIEPLCGLYKAGALNTIHQLYKQEGLEKHSMHFLLKQLQTIYIDVPSRQEDRFANFNSEADLLNLYHP